MIQLSHPSRLWVYLILSLYLTLVGLTGIALFIHGLTVVKLLMFAGIVSLLIVLLKPHVLFKTQEVQIGEGYIFLPLHQEKIIFEKVLRIRRPAFHAFYTIELKDGKFIHFINLSMDNVDNLSFESEEAVIKKLRKATKAISIK